MAGFDFSHRCQLDEEPLVRTLLRRAQPMARSLDLELKYKREPDHWYVVVNGPLPMMQTLIAALSRDWHPFAEGFPRPPALSRRRRAAQKLLDDYCAGAARMREMIEHTMTTLAGGTHYSFFFDVGGATHLASHARDVSAALVSFHNGPTSASQVGETIHTFVEAVAKTLLKPTGNHTGSYTALVHRIAASAGLDSEEIEALIRLKNLRRDAKHRNQRIGVDALTTVLPGIVGAIQKMVRAVREQHAARTPRIKATLAITNGGTSRALRNPAVHTEGGRWSRTDF